MEKINTIITGLLLMILISCNSSPTQIFVAPNGSDTSVTGSIDQPFASLERARDEIRSLKNERKTDNGIHVNLREGKYYLSETFTLLEEDAGKEESPVVYTAYNNEKVIIHGGISIPSEEISKTIAPEVLIRFQAEVQDKIVEIDLQKVGITDYGKMRPVGFSRPFGPTWAELFVNGEPYELARWPNDSTVEIGKVIDTGSVPRDGDFSNRGGIFHYDTDRPLSWQSHNDIWISGYFGYGWAEDAVELASIDRITANHLTA